MKTVVTHNGPFHADDLFAVAMLAMVGKAEKIIRTRDADVINHHHAQGALVVDVGGKYAPSDGWFDHHFTPQPKSEDGTLLASAGMVLRALEASWSQDGTELKEIVASIDATDTGTKVPGWELSMVLHKCNPLGNAAPEDFDRRFEEVVAVVVKHAVHPKRLVDRILRDPQVVAWVAEYDAEVSASENRVREAITSATEKYVVLSRYEPAMNGVLPEAPSGILYAIFPSPGGEWMVQQIPVSPGSFQGRKPLPEAWAGKRAADLDAATGIEGGVFCHPGRFIAGHKTRDGAIELAILAAS